MSQTQTTEPQINWFTVKNHRHDLVGASQYDRPEEIQDELKVLAREMATLALERMHRPLLCKDGCISRSVFKPNDLFDRIYGILENEAFDELDAARDVHGEEW